MARLIELRGAAGPVNEGERRVIAALLEQLPDGYWVAPNIEIIEPGGQHFEYDAVVLAPHAVYVVETKDWRGAIGGDEREWVVNGASRRAPMLTAERKAKVLKSKLVGRAHALARVWVEAAIVLASQPARLELTEAARRRVFDIDGLVRFIADPTAIGRRPDEIRDLFSQVLRAVSEGAKPQSGPTTFGAYEVIERLEQGSDEALYRARRRDMPAAPPVRLRVVTLSPYALTEQQRAERRAALKRETEALLAMGSHPNIVAAREVFDDEEGRVILVLDDAEVRTLRARLTDGTPLTVQERLDVLIGVARALAHAHAHKVIHRQVEPSTVFVGDDGSVRLGGFSLAKIEATGAATVWSDEAAAAADQRYLAPELLNPALGSPSPATDLYALGCIAYELFAGRPPFESALGAFTAIPPLPAGAPTGLGELLGSLLAGNPAQRPLDAKDVLAALEGMRAAGGPPAVTGPKDQYEPGDLIDGKFEVRGRLGGGGFSTVYRVYWAMGDREYALKVFNVNADFEKVKREFAALQMIAHPRVVRPVWMDHTRAGQWYLVTELIEGEPLEKYAYGEKRLAAAEAVAAVCQVLSALEAIHPDAERIAELKAKAQNSELDFDEYQELLALQERGIVHRDIKPQNLMLTADGVVLIDFNIASPVGQKVLTTSGTPRYQSPDIIAGLESWDVSPDLFAVGVVLYELLTSQHPWEGEMPRPDAPPRDPRRFRSELAPAVAEFLLKACAPQRADRFASAHEMRTVLEAIDPLLTVSAPTSDGALPASLRALLATHPPNVNPMVREFLALSSQARRTNRGTRGMDDLAVATYVHTRLDDDLSASVLAGRHRLVIITGNAGDGKTAFIQQVEAQARRAGAVPREQTANGSRLSYAGREIVTLYDGSQDEEDRTSDAVLREFLAPFAVGGVPDSAVRLAAINEGRLRDFLLAHRDTFPSLTTDVIAVLDDPAAPSPGEGVVIVNLNLRSVTEGGAQSIFSRQLRAIVEGPFWAPCEGCAYRTRCPIKHNIDTFRDSTSGAAVAERLRMLVDLVRLRRRRHLTMRDVRSLISHLLFRDHTCEEIWELLASDEPLDVIDLAYFQGPGGLGTPPGSALERGAELLTAIDVALVANPEDDRAIAAGEGPRRMAFPDRASDYPAELIRSVQARAGNGYESDPVLARRGHDAARRLFYFERADDEWWAMLPYTRLDEFRRALMLTEDGAQTRATLRDEVITAISMYEGMIDPDRAGRALWLATSEAEGPAYRCFRRFPLTDFTLRVASIEAQYIETEADRLELLHLPSGTTLDLDIDLVEVLERLGEGYVPSMDEERGFLLNLALFKNRLLAMPSSELMILADDQVLRITRGTAPGSVALTEEVA
jgi:serine/threonine protein kinase